MIADYRCEICGETKEVLTPQGKPECCGHLMTRLYSRSNTKGNTVIRMKYPMWIDRLEDTQKAQNDRGEKRKLLYPSQLKGWNFNS